jgi:hypothetical protein
MQARHLPLPFLAAAFSVVASAGDAGDPRAAWRAATQSLDELKRAEPDLVQALAIVREQDLDEAAETNADWAPKLAKVNELTRAGIDENACPTGDAPADAADPVMLALPELEASLLIEAAAKKRAASPALAADTLVATMRFGLLTARCGEGLLPYVVGLGTYASGLHRIDWMVRKKALPRVALHRLIVQLGQARLDDRGLATALDGDLQAVLRSLAKYDGQHGGTLGRAYGQELLDGYLNTPGAAELARTPPPDPELAAEVERGRRRMLALPETLAAVLSGHSKALDLGETSQLLSDAYARIGARVSGGKLAKDDPVITELTKEADALRAEAAPLQAVFDAEEPLGFFGRTKLWWQLKWTDNPLGKLLVAGRIASALRTVEIAQADRLELQATRDGVEELAKQQLVESGTP